MNKEKNRKNEPIQNRFVIEQSRNHMNTTFTFELSIPEVAIDEGDRLLTAMHEKVSMLEEKISEFNKESDLSRIHRAEPREPVPVSEETMALCEGSRFAFEWSGGAFDPSFRSKNGLNLIQNFSWNTRQKTVLKTTHDSRLGFGAIGKGFALDLVAQTLLDSGFVHFKLNAGGSSIVLSGSEAAGVQWKMGFAWKKSEGRLIGEIMEVRRQHQGAPIYLGVSGSMEQGEHLVRLFEKNSDMKPISVMVSAKNAALADAFSTAIYLKPELAEKQIEDCLVIVDNKENLFTNQAFQRFFQWSD